MTFRPNGIIHSYSAVVKDLRLENEDKDEYLKIGPRGSSRTRTFLEDNNTVNTGSQLNARVS